MIYACCYDNEIRLWWDERVDIKPGMKYCVLVNDTSVIYTDKVYYNFKNLQAEKKYKFEVMLVDENKNKVGESEIFYASTKCSKELVDISKPPYNAIGDGKTDNTLAIKKALADCSDNKIIYFPFGVYLCEDFSFSGSACFKFDAGATLCTKSGCKSL